MTRKQFFHSACVPLLALGFLPACVPQDTPPAEGSARMSEDGYSEPDHKAAIAHLQPTSNGDGVDGEVTFEKTTGDKIRVHARVTGLEPNSEHGFHIHQFGDLSAEDGKSAGGHFNPDEKPHDMPPESERHAGDLGNIKANAEGVAEKTIEVSKISLGGENSILGRAVVIHAKPDTGVEPSGDAGKRIAVGVIGLKEPGSDSKS